MLVIFAKGKNRKHRRQMRYHLLSVAIVSLSLSLQSINLIDETMNKNELYNCVDYH